MQDQVMEDRCMSSNGFECEHATRIHSTTHGSIQPGDSNCLLIPQLPSMDSVLSTKIRCNTEVEVQSPSVGEVAGGSDTAFSAHDTMECHQPSGSMTHAPRKRALLDDEKALEIFKLRGKLVADKNARGTSSSLFTARSILVSQVQIYSNHHNMCDIRYLPAVLSFLCLHARMLTS